MNIFSHQKPKLDLEIKQKTLIWQWNKYCLSSELRSYPTKIIPEKQNFLNQNFSLLWAWAPKKLFGLLRSIQVSVCFVKLYFWLRASGVKGYRKFILEAWGEVHMHFPPALTPKHTIFIAITLKLCCIYIKYIFIQYCYISLIYGHVTNRTQILPQIWVYWRCG